MMPLLISADFDKRSSILKAAILERLYAGCLSAPKDKGKILTVQ